MYVIQKGIMKTYIVRFRQFSCGNSTHPLKYNYVSSLCDKVIIIISLEMYVFVHNG